MRRFALLMLFVFLPACGSLTKVQPPEVAMVNVRAADVDVYQPQGQVALQLTNNNDQPLSVTGATYEIIIDETHVGRAISGESVEIPPHESAAQRATLFIRDSVMLNRLRVLLQQPNIRYAMRGSLQITTSDGRSGTLSTQSAGELNAKTD